MNKNLRSDHDKLVHLLSIIDGCKLGDENLIQSVLILSELATILSKTVYYQATNSLEARQKLIEEVNSFSTPHSFSYQLTSLIVENAIYDSHNILNESNRYLTKSQNFLLISYCYKLLVDTKANLEQIVLLKQIARSFNLDNKLILALETVFQNSQKIESSIFREINKLLVTKNFQDLDENIILKATDILDAITNCQQNQQVSVKNNKVDRQKILADIGTIAALDVKLYYLSQLLQQKTIDQAIIYWKNWFKNFKVITESQSKSWTCNLEEEYQIFHRYTSKLNFFLQQEINKALKEAIGNKIVMSRIINLEREIEQTLEQINNLLLQSQKKSIPKYTKLNPEYNFDYKLKLALDYQEIKSSLQTKGLITNNAYYTNSNVIANNIKNFSFDKLLNNSKEEKKQSIKQLTIEQGLKQISKLETNITRHIEQTIINMFDRKVEMYRKQITEALLILEILIK